MTSDALRIYQEALRLPPEERADVAGLLFESLEEVEDSEVEAAWRAEVARRVRDLDDGVSSTVPWEELRRRLEDRTA